MLHFTVRYVGWKIKVQLKADLIFHYLLQEKKKKKKDQCNSFSFPLLFRVVSSGSKLHAMIFSAIALASSLQTTLICVCFLC